MGSTNQSPEYLSAEKKFYFSKTDEEKLVALEEMIRFVPKHKAGESMRANLKKRYIKLRDSIDKKKKQKKKGSGGKEGIKKEEMQAVLVGLTNSGKSAILSTLTNAAPNISSYQYTTVYHLIGTMNYDYVQFQLIDLPAIESEFFDQGIANTADTLLIVITSPLDLPKIFPLIEKASGKRLIVVNKSDLLSETEKRKISAFMSSKKYNFVFYSAKTKENIVELKDKIWQTFDKIRVYTKEPSRPADSKPIILPKNSTIKDVAEKIFHGFSTKVKETKVTGPSSKFPNQKVSLTHVVKDKDIVEFKTK